MTTHLDPLQQRLQNRLTDRLESAQTVVDRFITRISSGSPCDAFEWAQDAMDAAAVIHVYTIAKAMLAEHGEEATIRQTRRVAMDLARYPAFSTSPASNAMQLFKAAAWAKVTEDLEG